MVYTLSLHLHATSIMPSLQVPESFRKCVPGDFEVVAQRKGFLRYRNPDLTDLVAAHAAAVQRKEACLASALQVLPLPLKLCCVPHTTTPELPFERQVGS